MRRLPFLAILVLAPGLRAQSAPVPIQGPVRHAGVYHVDTATWTRKVASIGLGADVVYNNTCTTGYYLPLSGDTLIDEGRLPSTSSPTNNFSRPGCAPAYTIDGVDLGVCTDAGPGATYFLDFYQSYVGCSSVMGVPPTGSIALPLPSGITGTLACWLFTVDLGQNAFTMLADGNGAYTGNSSQNLFGWSMRASSPTVGPFIAGELSVSTCTQYDGTRWDNGPAAPFWPNNVGESGTGMGTLDQFRLEGGPSAPGCYFGSGDLLRSFYLRMYADACGGPTGQTFCAGDGSATPCFCGNNSAPGSGEGCFNTTSLGARLTATGDASIAADSLVLVAAQMPPNSSVLFFQGTTMVNGGMGALLGDGLRCAGGSVIRLGTRQVDANGRASYPASSAQPAISVQGAVVAPGMRTYQVWYRNAAPFCTAATFNLSNGWRLDWGA